METRTLNTLVTGAIWRAEQLEAHGIIPAFQAWAEVSALEEELAKAHRASSSQGRIARRGAVRAAFRSGAYVRAQALADSYLAESSAPKSLRASLIGILEAEQEKMSIQFPYAAKQHPMRNTVEIAYRIRDKFSLPVDRVA